MNARARVVSLKILQTRHSLFVRKSFPITEQKPLFNRRPPPYFSALTHSCPAKDYWADFSGQPCLSPASIRENMVYCIPVLIMPTTVSIWKTQRAQRKVFLVVVHNRIVTSKGASQNHPLQVTIMIMIILQLHFHFCFMS